MGPFTFSKAGITGLSSIEANILKENNIMRIIDKFFIRYIRKSVHLCQEAPSLR